MCLAIPGKIVRVDEGDSIYRTGKVDFGGILKDVNLAYLPEAGVGDYVLVHVGFAISRIDAEEAVKTLEFLNEIGEGIASETAAAGERE